MKNLPDKIFGIDPKKAYKEFLKNPNSSKQPKPLTTNQDSKLEGFIYVPSINLHIAKERSHCNLNWEEAYKQILQEGYKMPTIIEFAKLLNFLRDNPSVENTEFYNEITEVKSPWRANHLDARFEKTSSGLYICYNHVLDSQNNLKANNTEQLTDYLTENKLPGISLDNWIDNPTKHGLPKSNIQEGQLWYWAPVDERVAGLGACSGGADLYCGGDPDCADAGLGVFLCAEGANAQKN